MNPLPNSAPFSPPVMQTGPFADATAAAAAAAAAAGRRTNQMHQQQHQQHVQQVHRQQPAPAAPAAAPPGTPLSPPPILHATALSPAIGGGGDGSATPLAISMHGAGTAAAVGAGSDHSGSGSRSRRRLMQPIFASGATAAAVTAAAAGGGGGFREEFGEESSNMNMMTRGEGIPPPPPPPSLAGIVHAPYNVGAVGTVGTVVVDASPSPTEVGQGGGFRQQHRQGFEEQFATSNASSGDTGNVASAHPMAPPTKRRRTMMESFEDMSLNRSGVRGNAALDLAGGGGALGGITSGGSIGGNTMADLHGSAAAGFDAMTNGIAGRGLQRGGGAGGAGAGSGGIAEETIEEDPLDVTTSRTGGSIEPGNDALPELLPPRPDPNVVRITSSDFESSDTDAASMDEGLTDNLPDIHEVVATPDNPVDARIEELIRKDRLRAMVRARLEAEGKSVLSGAAAAAAVAAAAGGGGGGGAHEGNTNTTLRTRDDFDLQGTFTTAGSATIRRPTTMTRPPSTMRQQLQQPATAATSAFPATAAATATAVLPPSGITNNKAQPPGMQRGRSADRRGQRGARSRSLPRQLEKLSAPHPSRTRDVSMASASSGGGGGGSDMDI